MKGWCDFLLTEGGSLISIRASSINKVVPKDDDNSTIYGNWPAGVTVEGDVQDVLDRIEEAEKD